MLVAGNLCIHNTLDIRRGGAHRVLDRCKEENETLEVGTSRSSTSSKEFATVCSETALKDR